MAGLVQAIHVIKRMERPQANSRNKKLRGYGPLQRAVPLSNRSLRRRDVDGRDKPGHDDSSSKRNRQ